MLTTTGRAQGQRKTPLPERLWEPDHWYRPIMTVEDLSDPECIAQWHGHIRQFCQFAMDWNRMLSQRDIVLKSRMREDVDPIRAAEIAAVLHALCVRDEEPVPDWVHKYSLQAPGAILCNPDIDMNCGFATVVVGKSPVTCKYHRVWFEAEIIAT